MQTKCPFAEWRPLGDPTDEPRIGVPRVLIFHTMAGYLAGTDSFFKQNGYGGTESHFGVGGKWDGSNDGAIYQWQLLDRQADAQYEGNAYATSIETSDGANSGVEWSPKQIDALVKLATWWCKETDNPPVLVASPSGHGFGYHSQFTEAWNRGGHVCPGAPRIRQLKDVIIPRVRAILSGEEEDDMPTAKEIATAVVNEPFNGRGDKVAESLQTSNDKVPQVLTRVTALEEAVTAQGVMLQQIWEKLNESPTTP